jgi:hypothetical protein
VPSIFPEQLSWILGQAVGWVANGADDGPKDIAFLVYIRKPVQSRRPRTLWPQLLDDLLGNQRSEGFPGNLL